MLALLFIQDGVCSAFSLYNVAYHKSAAKCLLAPCKWWCMVVTYHLCTVKSVLYGPGAACSSTVCSDSTTASTMQ
jgi:hypothetical protein